MRSTTRSTSSHLAAALRLCALTLLVFASSASAQSTICGDCDGDGRLAILDSLVAAKSSAGLTALDPTAFTRCNVAGLLEPDPGAEVTVIDALSMARYVAGLTGTLNCATLSGIYVDGDFTGTPQGTRAAPYITINAAVMAAQPGDTIHVDYSATPYDEVVDLIATLIDVEVVGDNWNQPGSPRPVIKPVLAGIGPAITIRGGSEDVTIRRLEVHPGLVGATDPTGTCISMGQALRPTIVDCVITGRNDAVTTAPSGHTRGIASFQSTGLTVEHCHFTGLDDSAGSQIKKVTALFLKRTTNCIIQSCEFDNLGSSPDYQGSFTLEIMHTKFAATDNVIFRNNLVHDITVPASSSHGSGATHTFSRLLLLEQGSNIQILNNTFANMDISAAKPGAALQPKWWAGISLADGPASTLICANNIFSHFSFDPLYANGATYTGVNQGTSPPPVTLGYNCVDTSWDVRFAPAALEDITGYSFDPGFETLGSDYHLATLPLSPSIDAGDPGVLDDDGSLSDLGCYGGERSNLPVGLLTP